MALNSPVVAASTTRPAASPSPPKPVAPDASLGLHESRLAGRARWLAAALVVLSVHVGGAALAWKVLPDDTQSAEDVGAPMVVEFAELPVAPEQEEADSTAAESSDGAPPSPEISEKLSAKTEDDLPTAEASPYEAPPDLQLAQEKTLEKTETEENAQPTEAIERQQEAAPSAAAQTSVAATPMMTTVAEAMAAPDEGSVLDAAKMPKSWQRAVVAHLGRHKRYPAKARSTRAEGEVLLHFVIDRQGKVLRKSVTRSSGEPLLDEEALTMLARAEPMPALPAQVRGASVELVVPIRYRLK